MFFAFTEKTSGDFLYNNRKEQSCTAGREIIMNSTEYLSWIKEQAQDDYSIQEKDENHLILEDEACEGEINVYHLENDVIELHLRRKDDGESVFFLHFELKNSEHAKELFQEMVSTLRKQKDRKTLKVLLSCTSGLTTSFFAEKMKEAARTLSLDWSVSAVEYPSLYKEGLHHDVILLAPQIAYEIKKVQSIFHDRIVRKIPGSIFASYDAGAAIGLVKEALDQKRSEDKKQETARIMRDIDASLRIFVINMTYDGETSRCIWRLYDSGNVEAEDAVIKEKNRLEDIVDILDTQLYKYRKDKEIHAIAVSLPGVLLKEMELQRVDYTWIQSMITDRYGIPAFVCNNTKAIAFGWYAQQNKYDSIVYHSQPAGHLKGGQGMVIAGRPVMGAHSMGGEIESLFPINFPGRSNDTAQSLAEIRESVIKYLVAACAIADPQVILVRNIYTPDMEDLKDGMKEYMNEKNIPELIYVRDITEYAYLGTMLYGVWKYKNSADAGWEDR